METEAASGFVLALVGLAVTVAPVQHYEARLAIAAACWIGAAEIVLSLFVPRSSFPLIAAGLGVVAAGGFAWWRLANRTRRRKVRPAEALPERPARAPAVPVVELPLRELLQGQLRKGTALRHRPWTAEADVDAWFLRTKTMLASEPALLEEFCYLDDDPGPFTTAAFLARPPFRRKLDQWIANLDAIVKGLP